jgi:hypothetical protein
LTGYSWLPLVATLLVSLLVALWAQWPVISDGNAFQDDFRKFHWLHRYQEPELFLTDRLTISSLREVEVGSGEFLLDGW